MVSEKKLFFEFSNVVIFLYLVAMAYSLTRPWVTDSICAVDFLFNKETGLIPSQKLLTTQSQCFNSADYSLSLERLLMFQQVNFTILLPNTIQGFCKNNGVLDPLNFPTREVLGCRLPVLIFYGIASESLQASKCTVTYELHCSAQRR